MAKPGSGRSSSAVTWVWAVAALLVVGLFLVWLGVTSEPSAVAAPEPDTTEVAGGPMLSGEPIEPAALQSDAESLVGRQVEVPLPVVSKLGGQLLWMELPDGGSYLVKTDAATAAQLQANTRVLVVGTVRMKTDSVLSEWQQAGLLASEGDVSAARFGRTYLDAVSIRPAGS